LESSGGDCEMSSDDFKNQCADPTEELTLKIPCRLAERIEAYASANKTTITNVVIEALDVFLREKK
jgi:hypothetical protein